MIISYIWTGMVLVSIFSAVITGSGGALSGAVMQGAQSGITLCISIAGAICLWSGVGRLMERVGITEMLSKLLKPLLHRLFPTCRRDAQLSRDLSANICANLLGLGNAATPMGVQAAKRLAAPGQAVASDELCRLIVLNTASIQFLPTNVAAVRNHLGCAAPFDILPAVWITSLCSAGLGVGAAFLLEKIWRS